MRKTITWMCLVIGCALGLQAAGYEYQYRGEPRPLTLHTARIYVLLESGQTQADLNTLLPDAKITAWGAQDAARNMNPVEGFALKQGRHWAALDLPSSMTNVAYEAMIERLNKSAKVALASPFFTEPLSKPIGMSELFRVKLRSAADLSLLKKMAAQTRTTIIGQNQFMPLWYTLACDKQSQGNALAMANHFGKLGKFDVSEPDLIPTDVMACTTDPFFTMQWGMSNTGQYGGIPGTDINACLGWSNWTTGDPNVHIAIFDQGFEANHPDLAAGVVGIGFDAFTGTSPAIVQGAHGTACAGIAGARQNNGQGVTGVAPNCGLVDISHPLWFTPNFTTELANGFNWAWTNNVAVISNSWGWFGAPAAILDNAIDNALTLGRGGLGTVVCFATHNYDLPQITYPASANSKVLAVGAMSPCGERKNPGSCDLEGWGSNYGPDLDVMAPGVKVHTTDQQGWNGYDATDYYATFNGTSSACPHVAGLAGLVISMNNCLTREQVNNIIERSARKVGGYAYGPQPNRPNGDWNFEMGYGLIDVDAALRLTREVYVQNVAINVDSTVQVFGTIAAGFAVTPLVPVGNVDVNAGATLKLFASTSVTLAPGFNVNPGAALQVSIIPFLNCGFWDLSVGRYAPPVVEAAAPPAAAESKTAIGNGTSAFDVYPNPLRNRVHVDFELAAAADVAFALYDIGTHPVAGVSAAGQYKAGKHSLDLAVNDLAAGVYFLRMRVGETYSVRKVIVLP